MSESFGFSISCYRGDVPFLRALLESVCTFAPGVPICLVVDGNFSTRNLERIYGVQVLRREEVKDAGLRKRSFGYGATKMVAFWESPFERVFHIDADTVLWGDIRRNIPAESWDVLFNEPHEVITPELQNSQYFDTRRVFDFIEPFPWQGLPYFNSGVLGVRRGCLDLDEYLRLVELQHKQPYLLQNGDQGILNILVFRAAQAGKLKAVPAHLQTVVPVYSRTELENRFRIENGQPVLLEQPTIIHWAGPKPWSDNKNVFSAPMDFFREKAMRRCGLPVFAPTAPAMAADEFWSRTWPRQVKSARRAAKRILGRA